MSSSGPRADAIYTTLRFIATRFVCCQIKIETQSVNADGDAPLKGGTKGKGDKKVCKDATAIRGATAIAHHRLKEVNRLKMCYPCFVRQMQFREAQRHLQMVMNSPTIKGLEATIETPDTSNYTRQINAALEPWLGDNGDEQSLTASEDLDGKYLEACPDGLFPPNRMPVRYVRPQAPPGMTVEGSTAAGTGDEAEDDMEDAKAGAEAESEVVPNPCAKLSKFLEIAEEEPIVTQHECVRQVIRVQQELKRHATMLANSLGVTMRGDEPSVVHYDKFVQYRNSVFNTYGDAVIATFLGHKNVPNPDALNNYHAAGESMCVDIGACSSDDENQFYAYWHMSLKYNSTLPFKTDAFDLIKMQQQIVDGGQPAYPPGWRAPLPPARDPTDPSKSPMGDSRDRRGDKKNARKSFAADKIAQVDRDDPAINPQHLSFKSVHVSLHQPLGSKLRKPHVARVFHKFQQQRVPRKGSLLEIATGVGDPDSSAAGAQEANDAEDQEEEDEEEKDGGEKEGEKEGETEGEAGGNAESLGDSSLDTVSEDHDDDSTGESETGELSKKDKAKAENQKLKEDAEDDERDFQDQKAAESATDSGGAPPTPSSKRGKSAAASLGKDDYRRKKKNKDGALGDVKTSLEKHLDEVAHDALKTLSDNAFNPEKFSGPTQNDVKAQGCMANDGSTLQNQEKCNMEEARIFIKRVLERDFVEASQDYYKASCVVKAGGENGKCTTASASSAACTTASSAVTGAAHNCVFTPGATPAQLQSAARTISSHCKTDSVTTQSQSIRENLQGDVTKRKTRKANFDLPRVPGFQTIGAGINTYTGEDMPHNVLLFDSAETGSENSPLAKKYRIPRAFFSSPENRNDGSEFLKLFSTDREIAVSRCRRLVGPAYTMFPGCMLGSEEAKIGRSLEADYSVLAVVQLTSTSFQMGMIDPEYFAVETDEVNLQLNGGYEDGTLASRPSPEFTQEVGRLPDCGFLSVQVTTDKIFRDVTAFPEEFFTIFPERLLERDSLLKDMYAEHHADMNLSSTEPDNPHAVYNTYYPSGTDYTMGRLVPTCSRGDLMSFVRFFHHFGFAFRHRVDMGGRLEQRFELDSEVISMVSEVNDNRVVQTVIQAYYEFTKNDLLPAEEFTSKSNGKKWWQTYDKRSAKGAKKIDLVASDSEKDAASQFSARKGTTTPAPTSVASSSTRTKRILGNGTVTDAAKKPSSGKKERGGVKDRVSSGDLVLQNRKEQLYKGRPQSLLSSVGIKKVSGIILGGDESPLGDSRLNELMVGRGKNLRKWLNSVGRTPVPIKSETTPMDRLLRHPALLRVFNLTIGDRENGTLRVAKWRELGSLPGREGRRGRRILRLARTMGNFFKYYNVLARVNTESMQQLAVYTAAAGHAKHELYDITDSWMALLTQEFHGNQPLVTAVGSETELLVVLYRTTRGTLAADQIMRTSIITKVIGYSHFMARMVDRCELACIEQRKVGQISWILEGRDISVSTSTSITDPPFELEAKMSGEMADCAARCLDEAKRIQTDTFKITSTTKWIVRNLLTLTQELACNTCRELIVNELDPNRSYPDNKEGEEGESGAQYCDQKPELFDRALCHGLVSSLTDAFAELGGVTGSTRLQPRPLNYYLNVLFANFPGRRGEYAFGFDGTGIDPDTRTRYSRNKVAATMCAVVMRCPRDTGRNNAKKSEKEQLVDETRNKLEFLGNKMKAAATEITALKLASDKASKEQMKAVALTQTKAKKDITCAKHQLRVLGARVITNTASGKGSSGPGSALPRPGGDVADEGNEKMKRCYVCQFLIERWKSADAHLEDDGDTDTNEPTIDAMKDEVCSIVEKYTALGASAMSGGGGGATARFKEETDTNSQPHSSRNKHGAGERLRRHLLSEVHQRMDAMPPPPGCIVKNNVSDELQDNLSENWDRRYPKMNRRTCEVLVNEIIFDMQDRTSILASVLGLGIAPKLTGLGWYKVYTEYVSYVIKPPSWPLFDYVNSKTDLPNQYALRGTSRAPGYGIGSRIPCVDLHVCEAWNVDKVKAYFALQEQTKVANWGKNSSWNKANKTSWLEGPAIPPGFAPQKHNGNPETKLHQPDQLLGGVWEPIESGSESESASGSGSGSGSGKSSSKGSSKSSGGGSAAAGRIAALHGGEDQLKGKADAESFAKGQKFKGKAYLTPRQTSAPGSDAGFTGRQATIPAQSARIGGESEEREVVGRGQWSVPVR